MKKTRKSAPYIHDLNRLAKLTGFNLSNQQARDLRLITSFNIAGRYSDVKLQFYKKATKLFTGKNLKIAKKLYLWLQKEYQKK